MHGTVRSFDVRTRTGSVLRDDGTVVTFDQPAFDASGLRHLRVGQRVRLGFAGRRVALVTIATLPEL
ncbi:MAG TPA: hypothetical protein VNE21_07745 [Mycobacteriales bacterium]|nr:hypothetical protein [Mycobacteriales bacterium]